MKHLGAIVMAAGLGKRMRSKIGKVLHPVAGRPMILYAVELAERLADTEVVVVVGHQGDQVKAVLDRHLAERNGSGARPAIPRDKGLTAHVGRRASGAPLLIAEQTEQLGTGHAVMQARAAILRAKGQAAQTYMILNGDTPLLTEATLRRLSAVHHEEKAALTLLTARLADPSGYGRVVRQTTEAGRERVIKVVEDKDATPAEAALREINVGTYVVNGEFLFEALDRLQPQNAQKEYYLTDIVKAAVDRGLHVAAVIAPNPEEGLGVNSRQQLATAERILRDRIRERWMEHGVTLIDPATTWIDAEVTIGQDVVLYPHVTLEGRTTIGQDTLVRSHSRIANSTIGERVVVHDCCVVTESQVENEAVIGPFAHLRPASIVRRKGKVGNFVEMKNTELGEKSKANHLTYLGDTRVGKGVNIGAGTITCNYDGYHKYETVIEDDVFIGSDTQLVAPVKIGRGTVIGAGSTITQDVPADALALSRTPQVTRAGWATKRRALLTGTDGTESTRQGDQTTTREQGAHATPSRPDRTTRPRQKKAITKR